MLNYLDFVLGGTTCVFAVLWIATLFVNKNLSSKLALIISNYKADLELVTMALMNTNRALGITTDEEEDDIEGHNHIPQTTPPRSTYT